MTLRTVSIATTIVVAAALGLAEQLPAACFPEGTPMVSSTDPSLHLLARLDEPSGTRLDASDRANDLASIGDPLSSADREQGSASLDLVETQGQYLERASADLAGGFPGSPGASNAALTVGGWVKTKSTGQQPLVLKAADPGQRSWSIWIWNGVLDPNVHLDGFDDSGPAGDFLGTTPIVVGQWYHFVYTFDGASGLSRLYVDGTLDAGPFDEQMSSFFAGTAPLRLGYRPGFCADCAYADARLDEVFVMDRVLTDEEVASVYQHGIVDPGGCDDGIACTENDTCVTGVCQGTPNHALCGGADLCTAGRCDPTVGCVDAEGVVAAPPPSAMTLRQAQRGKGDGLVIRGRLTLPESAPALDLVRDGVVVQLVSHDARVLYRVAVPGGFDAATARGWTTKSAGRAWRYRDAAGSVGGIQMVAVQVRTPRQRPAFVRVVVRGRSGSYTVAPSDLPLGLQVLLGADPAVCAEMQYGPPGRPLCRIVGSGGALRCG